MLDRWPFKDYSGLFESLWDSLRFLKQVEGFCSGFLRASAARPPFCLQFTV